MDFPTDKTPFNWIRLETEGNSILSARLYHTACVYQKINGESESMVLFGGRDSQNVSLVFYLIIIVGFFLQ